MNLYKRGDYFWYRFRLHGRQHRGTTKTANRQLAMRIAGRKYNDALEGKTLKIYRTPLSVAIKQYLAHIAPEQATAAKAARVLKQFLAYLTDRRLADISPFLIEKWKLDRTKAVEQSTVNRELNVVRGFFTRCVAWKLCPVSPAAGVLHYKTDDIRVRVLTGTEIQAILTDAPPAIGLLCRATLECLPRLSELLTLRTEHIGPTWIEVRRKGGHVQRLPVTAALREALLAQAHRSGFVFGVGDAGEPPTQQTATTQIVRHIERRGVSGASHHTFRHTGVTLMLEAGVNPRVIQQLAGWTSLRMLERYGHVRDTESRRAIDVTSEAIQAALTLPPPQQEKQA